MKKFSLFLIFIFLALLNSRADSLMGDSLMTQRANLYYQYLDVKNNTETFGLAEYQNVSAILEQTVLMDNIILDTLAARTSRLEKSTRMLEAASVLDDRETLELKNADLLHWIFIGAGGFFFALFILMLVLYLGRASTVAKLRKEILHIETVSEEDHDRMREELSLLEAKLLDKDTMIKKGHKEVESLNLRLSEMELAANSSTEKDAVKIADFENTMKEQALNLVQLKEENKKLQDVQQSMQHEIAELIRQLAEKEESHHKELASLQLSKETLEKDGNAIQQQLSELMMSAQKLESGIQEKEGIIAQLKEELQEWEHKMLDKEMQIEDFRQRSAHDDAYYAKLAEIDLSMIKLEKLDRLKDKEILTEEEYQTLKQKFLDLF